MNFYSKRLIRSGENLINLSKPLVMGIINCTPDSFYASSRNDNISEVLSKVKLQIEQGVDIIDFGGYSSRPGAENISIDEELNRVIPCIKAVRKNYPDILISIDTFRGKVADTALSIGANIVNDISGFELDDSMLSVLKKHQCPYILMHMKGNPLTMQNNTNYTSLFKEICTYFSHKIEILHQNGIYDVILDPGFGFSKNRDQNYELLASLQDFHFFNCPLLIGVSRKSMIYTKLNTDADSSLNGTTVLNTYATLNGASIIRVHDVKEAKEIINLLY